MAFNDEIMVASGAEYDPEHPSTEKATLESIPPGKGSDVVGVKGDAESTYRTGNVNITQDNIVGTDSTNNIADSDKIITKVGNTWYRKAFSKVWDYIKGKIGIASATNSYLRNDGTWTTELTPTKIVNTAVSDFTSGDSTDANATAWTSVTKVDNNTAFGTFFNRISTMMKNVRYLYKLLGTTDISTIGDGTVTGGLSSLKSSLTTKSSIKRGKASGTTDAYGNLVTNLTPSLEIISARSATTALDGGAIPMISPNSNIWYFHCITNANQIFANKSVIIYYYYLD